MTVIVRKFFTGRLFLWAACFFALVPVCCARTFDVVAYNVENLFDIDGKALFDDYQPDQYGPPQLETKVRHIAEVLSRFNNGAGPDIILFQEFEEDQTPSKAPIDYDGLMAHYAHQSLAELLTPPVSARVKDLPAQFFLLKALEEKGIHGYHVVVAKPRKGPDPLGHLVAHNNVVFSRFPVTATHTWETAGARGILEVHLSVDGTPLIVFDNHWKSGASDPKLEPIRIGNARVLRKRLDAILKADPSADIIIGGDFNSMYNQSRRYPAMPETGINSILHSQGDEAAMETSDGPDLYNLWYELPPKKRGSDVYHNEWGTLIQILVTRGLYDDKGIQYVDNSFKVDRFRGLNANPASGGPIRWSSAGTGSGFSDHLPVEATFRTVATDDPDHYEKLENPGKPDHGPLVINKLWTPSMAVDLRKITNFDSILRSRNEGLFYRVDARVISAAPLTIVAGRRRLDLWIPFKELRTQIESRLKSGEKISFFGVLGRYKGHWQFEMSQADWWLGTVR